MVSKENLIKLTTGQALMAPFLHDEALRKVRFLEDKAIGNNHNDFTHFDKIISNNCIFYGTDSELDDLRELVSLLKVM